jgi:hypothetical protein
MFPSLLKKHRLDNLNVILVSFISFWVSIATFSETIRIETGLSLIGTNPRLFSLLLAFLSGFVLLSSLILLLTKNNNRLSDEVKNKIMIILKIIMIFTVSLLVID